MKRVLNAVFAALFVLVLPTLALAQSVVSVGTGWTSLGYGPMTLVAPGAANGGVSYLVSATTPGAGATGAPIPSAYGVALLTTRQVWAQAASGTVSVSVTPYVGQIGVEDSATGGGVHAATGALASNLVLKAAPGALIDAACVGVSSSVAGYCVVINATAAPSSGAAITPLDVCAYPAGATGCAISRAGAADSYSTGVVVLATSAASPFTYTPANLFLSGDAQ